MSRGISWLALPESPASGTPEVLQWLSWIVHLQPPSGMSPIRYDRFSLYHERPADYGLTLKPNRAYSSVYPLSPEAMADLAYFFEDESDLTEP
jgi:magnesium-protoporphyrin IX monomethyl ester (oxidative) cyclase